MENAPLGSIGWLDLTVDDAESNRDFYEKVVGWSSEPVSMGEYEDYNMVTAEGPQAGVCHRRGSNSSMPPQWIPYIVIEDLETSLTFCESLGGSILIGPKKTSSGSYAVIRDPAGAAIGLWQNETAA